MQSLSQHRAYCADENDAKQVPSDVHGRGAGIPMVGPGPVAVIEACVEIAFVAAGEKDAETRPAKATNRANMRMATFIFGNLMEFNLERSFPPFKRNTT